MDGGKGQGSHNMAGGAGGVIQIIAPEGEIAAETLSFKHGEHSKTFCDREAENGYVLLEGTLVDCVTVYHLSQTCRMKKKVYQLIGILRRIREIHY